MLSPEHLHTQIGTPPSGETLLSPLVVAQVVAKNADQRTQMLSSSVKESPTSLNITLV